MSWTIRINELARELEVKPSRIIDLVGEFGVTKKITHSSSIDDIIADKVRALLGWPTEEVATSVTTPLPASPRNAPSMPLVQRPAGKILSGPRLPVPPTCAPIMTNPEPPRPIGPQVCLRLPAVPPKPRPIAPMRPPLRRPLTEPAVQSGFCVASEPPLNTKSRTCGPLGKERMGRVLERIGVVLEDSFPDGKVSDEKLAMRHQCIQAYELFCSLLDIADRPFQLPKAAEPVVPLYSHVFAPEMIDVLGVYRARLIAPSVVWVGRRRNDFAHARPRRYDTTRLKSDIERVHWLVVNLQREITKWNNARPLESSTDKSINLWDYLAGGTWAQNIANGSEPFDITQSEGGLNDPE